MSVTIFENDVSRGDDPGYALYFGDYGYGSYTPNLAYYALGYDGNTWDNDVSALYTTDYLYVFEYTGFDRSGAYALLPPGYHNLDSLDAYGISNDEISSFFTI